ncbi:extensin family protein [Roseibacterium sp. SDUM158017]|uniref:extensin-like domain-containing protein n=1 Tax=Roseicyclus salinarum TaxID=3036773 RepID=UPI00241536B4|nr:extensin family protein [Roseibacterium sp. SDUM158017]MDG4648283.1 extensin family protein [Roseibacterium sp. SDUM158017]
MRRGLRSAGLAALSHVLTFAAMLVPAMAEAPSRSLLPLPRATAEAAVAMPMPDRVPSASSASLPMRVMVDASRLAPGASLRPVARGGAATSPSGPGPRAAEASAFALASAGLRLADPRPGFAAATRTAPSRSLRPSGRPEGLERVTRAAAARLTPGRVTQPGTHGALCGIPGLVGERLQPITGRASGCGIAEPVRLREIDGVALTTPATISCDTARALRTWVREGLVPTVGRTGGGVRNLRVVASYACRTRNSQSGARLSEHARGNAIDIAGIGLADGSELTVLDDWRGGREGRILRRLHQAACGPFGTVLGPNSDRFHRDHFHFDVASYRSGSYCR